MSGAARLCAYVDLSTHKGFVSLFLLRWRTPQVEATTPGPLKRSLTCLGPCFRGRPPPQPSEPFTVSAQSLKSTFPINAALLLPPRCTPPEKCQHQYWDVLCVRLSGNFWPPTLFSQPSTGVNLAKVTFCFRSPRVWAVDMCSSCTPVAQTLCIFHQEKHKK